MQHYKLGFRNKSVDAQLNICERTLSSLAAGPEQVDAAKMANATEAVKELRASHEQIAALRGQLKAQIRHRKDLLRTAREQMNMVCLGAAIKVKHDAAGLRAIGLDLMKPRNVPVGVPAVPDCFRVEPTDSEGEARVRCRRPVRRCYFEIQACTDINKGNWKLMDTKTAQSNVVKELKSGMKYWFRICAKNSHGKSPWTKPVAVRVK